MEKIDKRSGKIWMIQDLFRAAGLAIVYGIVMALLEFFDYGLPLLLTIAIIAYLVVTTTIRIVDANLRSKTTCYEIKEEKVFSYTGGIGTEEVHLPLENVQHVNISQDASSRLYNLYVVIIYTAGNDLEISYIKKEEAERIKDYITEYLLEREA